ncbi:MAG: MFS transporter, partial [Proteobacteria bacterium]|nr:MFS transporter [Pseudomonadota bacterium]
FFYGWIVVAVAFVTMALGVNVRTTFSLLFPPILDEFGWSSGTIAATFSIGFIVSTLLAPFVGGLMDRFGPRIILPLAAIAVSAGLVTTTLATEPWHFYLTFGVLVIGGSVFMGYIGHTLILPNWFDRRRGLAIGIGFSGVGVGSILLLPWMQIAIQTVGWRQSTLTLAVVVLVVLVPLNFMFQRYRPEDIGLVPDGIPVREDGESVEADRGPKDRIVDHAWAATDWTVPLALRTGRFWWLLIAFVSGLYAWYAVLVHQTRYLIDVGISAEAASVALGLVGLGGIVGQIGIGHLSDRIGREWAWTISLSGFMATYGCLLLLREFPSLWLMYVMVGSQGFIGYGLASVFGAVPSELFAGKRYGAIFGILGGAAGLGAAFGPFATGLLHDIVGNYVQAFVVAIAVCGLSIIAMWLAGPRKVRLVPGRLTA